MTFPTGHRCPYCDRPQETVEAVGAERGPPLDDGHSVIICRRCYGISLFDSTRPTKTRPPSPEEFQSILEDLPPNVRTLRAAKIRATGVNPNCPRS